MSYATRLVNNALERQLKPFSYIIDNGFFSSQDVDIINNYCKGLNLSEGSLFSGESNYSERKANIAFIHSKDHINGWIYDKLNTLIGYYNDNYFGYDLVGYDYMQYAEYTESCHQNFHMDISFTIDKNYISDTLRKLSVVLLLSEPEVDFTGGDFLLNLSHEGRAERVNLRKGSVVMFPSFIIHKVAPVTSGLRKTLVVWPIGPKFK
jgi:PKHD-type hydroxylase